LIYNELKVFLEKSFANNHAFDLLEYEFQEHATILKSTFRPVESFIGGEKYFQKLDDFVEKHSGMFVCFYLFYFI